MKFEDLGTYYQKQKQSLEALAHNGGSLWRREAKSLLIQLSSPLRTTDGMLKVLHNIQRLHQIETAGLADNADFYQAVKKESPPTWKSFSEPPADKKLQISLAEKLYNIDPDGNDFAYITLGIQSKFIGPWLVEKCVEDNVPFIISFSEPNFHALLLNHADEKGVKALANDLVSLTTPANKRIAVASGLPEKTIKSDEEKSKIYSQNIRPYGERLSSGDLFFTLTVIPTPKDAEIDGFDYEDFTRLFFEMCDQPWKHIDKAQQQLIEEFNAASIVRITNNDGTDITMDIAGYTFANSLIAKNVPGSEIFSAPRIDSAEGTIVAKGKFLHGGEVIENLTMVFEKGKLVDYKADKGVEAFEKAINLDDGARLLGELGIGTNPHLKTHVANGLLVEKIGGSFHVALGKAYTLTEYEGVPVKLDNGNKSALHWDITTMLHGKEGKIYLDGRLVMDHGAWLDKKYDVLNRGWHAVPEDERPDYWKNPPAAPTPK